MPVKLPDVNLRRELARRVFDALVSEVPAVGGALAAVWSVTHPSDADKKWEAWKADITSSVNDIETLLNALAPTISLSDEASTLGYWLSQNSQDGRCESVVFERITSAFPDASRLELEDACGELELHQLVDLSGAIGHRIRLVTPTLALFVVFDPLTTPGADPRRDAAALSRRILKSDGTIGADELAEELGWSPRRFNPAMMLVADFIGPGRKSGEGHPTYACRYVMPDPRERAALRAFADSVLGPPDKLAEA